MESPFIINDHYWLRENGRAYSSARGCEVPPDDVALVAWLQGGGLPASYPTDKDGNESDEIFSQCLARLGLAENLCLSSSGTYHQSKCGYVGQNNERMTLSAIRASYPEAKPCSRCAPPALSVEESA